MLESGPGAPYTWNVDLVHPGGTRRARPARAERVALFTAFSEGERDFAAIAVVARAEGGPMPCGACRQLLAEFAPHARVWVADSRRPGLIREFKVAALLPKAFLDF